MGAADHHAVQGGRVLGDVDQDGPHLEHGRVVGLQAALGAVQGLGLGDVALHHRPGMDEEQPELNPRLINLIALNFCNADTIMDAWNQWEHMNDVRP